MNYTIRIQKTAILVMAIVGMGMPLFARAETLYRELQVGMTGTDVSALQRFLSSDTSIYPQGLVTGYYGYLTKAAVSNFQSRNGISNVGRVGPVTLPVINFQMANGWTGDTDLTAPIITHVNTDTGKTSAIISWTTSDFARGRLYYSTSPIQVSNTFDQNGVNGVEPTVFGTLAYNDTSLRTSQSATLSSLTPNTTYYYLIVASDTAGNVSITLPAYIRTSQ